MEAVLALKKWIKERDALYVVPVVMRHKNVGFDGVAAICARPAVAQHAHARAAIQDKTRAVRRGQFEARRVTTVAPGVALQRRRRAAHSPEDQLGNVVGHRRRRFVAPRLLSITISENWKL